MHTRRFVWPTICLGVVNSVAAVSWAQDLSKIIGAAQIDPSYYFTSQDSVNEGSNQIVGLGSGVVKLEMDVADLDQSFSANSKYAWNTPAWPSSNGLTLTALAQSTYFSQVFSNPGLSSYVITAYSPNIPSGGDGTEYWLKGMTTAQKQAETTSFYNLTKTLMQTYAGTGKSFYLEQWEGDWALKDPNRDTQPTATAVQGMIDWLNARQAGIDEARAQFASADPGVNVYGTVEVNRVADAINGDVFNGATGWATVTNDVLPHTDVDFASYSSYDTQQITSGPTSYANAVAYIAAHLPASAANGQNTHSVYVGEFGLAEDSAGATTVSTMMNNVLNTVKADGMPLALYWEMFSNELSNGNSTAPANTGNDSLVKGFYFIKPDGTPATAWHQYRYLLTTSDPLQATSAAVQRQLHLAYASNFTQTGATLGSAWTTNTSSGAMSVGISGGQVQMTTVNGATTPTGQATLNIDSVLGRGLKVGEYVQFSLNRASTTGIIGVSAFGLNNGSGTATGNQPLNAFELGGWKFISFNPTNGSSLSYNWNTTQNLGLRLISANGTFATLGYYINGTYSGSWLYPTTSTALDNISLFAQSNTTGTSFNFNNLTIYTANGNLAATSYQWDPHNNRTGGTGTWDPSTSANFYNGTTDTTWNNATLGDTTTFNATPGTVTVASAGVTASNLIFNVPNYVVTGSTITMMGSQTINATSGNATINSAIAGTSGLTVTGAGNVTLGGSNTFTNGLYITGGGTANFATDANLGAAGQPITLDNGTLSYAGATVGVTETARVFNINPNGGTINVFNSGIGAGKLTINGNGLIAGTGTFTKSGAGVLTAYGDNSATFSGNTIVTGGVMETGNANVLGTGAITVDNGAELALNFPTGTMGNAITLNAGATISCDNHVAGNGTISGPVTTTGNFNVRLGDFYSTFSNNVTITGNIAGTGAATIIAGSGGTTTTGKFILTGNNAGFSGGFVVPTGSLVAGLSSTNTLGTGSITLSGGKLSLQGHLAPAGTTPIAAVPITGFNRDEIYGNPDTSSFATTTTGADNAFSYFQTGYTPQFNPTATILNQYTALTNGLSGQNLTSTMNNTVLQSQGQTVKTPFALQSFMANNAMQIAKGSTGTFSLTTPAAFANLAILAASTTAAEDTPNVTINFTDGTSVTTTYKAYDWNIGSDPARQSASIFGAAGVNRYSATSSPGWDQRAFGMYETDLDLTNINGIDYSSRFVSSLTFAATTTTGGLTNIFALSGTGRSFATAATQTYTNPVILTADSGIDISGSLGVTMSSLSIGANKLSVTSSDTTSSPYSLSFPSGTLSGGSATIDVAASSGGGPGKVILGATGGLGSLNKTNSGTLELTGINTYSGSTTLTTGVLTLDAAASLASPTVTIGSGTTFNANGTLASNTTLNANGTVLLGANPNTGILTRTITALNLTSTGTVNILPTAVKTNRTVLVINGDGTHSGLTFSGGKLDVSNNDMIVKNANFTDLSSQLKAGFNAGIGYWNGTSGIISSTAAADNRFLTAIGYRPGGVLFDGNTTTTTSDALIKYTYYGDADLSGTLDGADYQQIDNGFGNNLTGWFNGDFNYDGVVNGSDFALIDNTFNQLTATSAQSLALIGSPADLTSSSTPNASPTSFTAVPEPTMLGLLGLGGISLLRRRRTR